MKKLILTVVVALFMAVVPAMSQVFVTDEEAWDYVRTPVDQSAIPVMVPEQDIKFDQFIARSVAAQMAGATVFENR